MAGCAAPEQPILEQFFAASRLRDKAALQVFASVIFEPNEQGIVRTFTIAGVSPERAAGSVVTKDVTVRAAVMTPHGTISDETLNVTLQRADERESGGYGWIVVAVKDGAGSRSAPHW